MIDTTTTSSCRALWSWSIYDSMNKQNKTRDRKTTIITTTNVVR